MVRFPCWRRIAYFTRSRVPCKQVDHVQEAGFIRVIRSNPRNGQSDAPPPTQPRMNFQDYLAHDATSLAALVARREVTPSELLELALAQLRKVQPRLNPVCRPMEEEARKRLANETLEGPLAGVPFLIKDCAHDYAGLPTSYCSRGMLRIVPQEHSAIVRRYLGAGLVVFGKTTTPEFALKAVSDSIAFGRVSNPWNPDHTPGGSSGGSAAAVAAGVVPMAAANDGGGSIRIPAACCGLFGLRPSRGRVSQGPGIGEVWFGANSEGVLSRSVRDTALALDVLQGPEPGDPFAIPTPAEPYVDAMRRAPGRLRIGFTTASPIGTEVHPEAVAAVNDAARLLEGLGHDVAEAAPDVDGNALARSFIHVYFGQVPAMMARARAAGAGDAEFEPLTRVLETLGKATSASASTTELMNWNDYARALARFHQRFDLLLTPTLAHPPVRHGAGDPPPAQRFALDSLQFVPFTQLSNLTGTPSMSVPLHWTAEGLPLGVQFVAPFGREDLLLQLAGQLEQARPWFQRLPAWVSSGGEPG
jgi:amidase